MPKIKRLKNRSSFFVRHSSLNGFTVVEVVVTLAIITTISTVVLVSFSGLNEGAALNVSLRELALNIRRAQNMSFAVTQLGIGSPPNYQIPPAVGLRLSTIPGEADRYFSFADLAISRDNRYGGPQEKIIDTDVVLKRRVAVNSITTPSSSYGVAHIIFSAPEASVFLSDINGASIGDRVDIELRAPSGQSKRITVRTSGQINIR